MATKIDKLMKVDKENPDIYVVALDGSRYELLLEKFDGMNSNNNFRFAFRNAETGEASIEVVMRIDGLDRPSVVTSEDK